MTLAHDTLEALREQGAHLHDPVRFRYLEALAARMTGQPHAVQQVLARRFDEAAADCRRCAEARQVAPTSMAALQMSQVPSPLAQLNQAITQGTDTQAADGLAHETGSPSDMKSVRRFAEVWSKIAADQQLTQALTRGPELAGPLNSHNLMLRAMSLMHSLSPGYLRRFLLQADALLWLDHMNQQNALKDGKTAKRVRARR
jgi:hypothetical protein